MMNYFLMTEVGIGMGAGISLFFFHLGDYHVPLGLPLFLNGTCTGIITSIHVLFELIVAILSPALLPL